MKRLLGAARNKVKVQAAMCAQNKHTLQVYREELRGGLYAELSRPGTLAGAFAVGAVVGGRGASSGGAGQAQASGDLEQSLDALHARLDGLANRVDDEHAAAGESAQAEPQGAQDGSDVVDFLSTVGISIVTRTVASLALEQLGKMRSAAGAQGDEGEPDGLFEQ